MQTESKQQILEHRKEIEQEIVEMLKETESDFTLDHVRDVIYNEEDNDDMMKAVAMFDRGGDASELSNVLELVTDAWNYPSSRNFVSLRGRLSARGAWWHLPGREVT
ncbi:MAG: hypothetical protein A2041_09995 [Bacteroidetes bacterium GWA2_31_9b]|nr:MAG: hypothetical protein A2041_09995 [Bacteroidetes bacterium GWA2_31_9b]